MLIQTISDYLSDKYRETIQMTKKGGCNAAYPYKRKAHIYMLRFLENNNLINNLKMKEKIKNQRSAGKVIPLHSKFTEPANDVSRDSEVLYGQKGKEVCRA